MSEDANINPPAEAPTPATPVASQTTAPAGPVEAAPIDIADFMKVSLRVAQILAAEPVPKSKKLLRLQLDLGPVFGQRQIVSGIALHYTPEALVGKRIVVVANLKPAQLMGIESNGMLLAGSSEDNSTLAIIEPHESLPLGATVR